LHGLAKLWPRAPASSAPTRSGTPWERSPCRELPESGGEIDPARPLEPARRWPVGTGWLTSGRRAAAGLAPSPNSWSEPSRAAFICHVISTHRRWIAGAAGTTRDVTGPRTVLHRADVLATRPW